MEKSIKIWKETYETLKQIRESRGIAMCFVVDRAVKDFVKKIQKERK